MRQSLLLGIIALLIFINILVITILFITQAPSAKNGSGGNIPKNQEPVTPPVFPPPTPDTPTPSQPTCSLMPCHGTENLNCSQEPIACTMEFTVEDTCRQFARCIPDGDTCTLTVDPKIEDCRECIKECEQSSNEVVDIFSCAEQCTQ